MRLRFRPLALCLPLLVAVPGCGGEERPAAAPTAAPAGTNAPQADAGAPADQRTIALLAPGQGDKRALRYVFHTDRAEVMDMAMDMSLVMTIGDKTVPESKLPRIKMAVSVVPKRLLPNGDLVFAFAFTSVDVVGDPAVKPEMITALRAEMGKMVGLKGEGEATTRGETIRADMEIPPAIDPKMREMLEQIRSQIEDLSVPFPEEPIAPGAQWRSTAPFFLGGIHAVRSVTYTLESLEGDHAHLKSDVGVTAAPQEIQKKDLPEGTKMMLKAMRAGGTGTIDVDLQALVPRSQARVDITVETSIEQGDQKAALAVTTKLDVAVAPGASGAH